MKKVEWVKTDVTNIEHLPGYFLYNCSGCLVGQRERGLKDTHKATEMTLYCLP